MEDFEVVFQWIKAHWATMLTLFGGLVAGIWAFVKVIYYPYVIRFIESVIQQEQVRRDRIREASVRLIIKRQNDALKNAPVSANQVNELYKEVETIAALSSGATADIVNFTVLLMRYFALLKKYMEKSQQSPTPNSWSVRTTQIYDFINSIVDYIHQNAVSPVPRPTLLQIVLGKDLRTIVRKKKPVNRFIRFSRQYTYQFSEFGPSLSPYSAESIVFLSNAFITNDMMSIRAAARSINRHELTVERIMYARGIYHPPSLYHAHYSEGLFTFKLKLIGILEETRHSDKIEDRVVFLYATDRETAGLPIKQDGSKDIAAFRLETSWLDELIEESFEFHVGEELTVDEESDVLRVNVGRDLAEDYFVRIRKKFERAMKCEMES